MGNTELQFYVDTMIVESLFFQDNELVKNAQSGMVMGLINIIKNYVADKINPNDKLGSVLNILTPGILAVSGFPVIAFIVKISEMFFGLDIGKIFHSVVAALKSLITSQGQVSDEHVDAAATAAVQENYGGDPTESDLAKAEKLVAKGSDKINPDVITIRSVQLYKFMAVDAMQTLSLEDLETQNFSLEKRAQIMSALMQFIGLKRTTGNILAKIIGWIVKVALAAGGFMLAESAVNKVLNRTNAPSTPSGLPSFVPSATPAATSIPQSRQTLFEVNPGYVEEKLNINKWWIETTPPEQIGEQVVRWAQEIYPDLKGKNNFIRSSASFQAVINKIQEFNTNNTSNVTFMPKIFTSKKKVVDLFIDDLASKAGTLPNTPDKNKRPAETA